MYHLAQILSILFCFFVIFLSKQGCRYILYNGGQAFSFFRRLCFLVETRGLDSRRLVACSVIAALTCQRARHSLPLPSIPLCKKQYRLTAAVFFGGNEGARFSQARRLLGHRGSDAPPARHSLPLPSIPLCKKQYRLTAAVFFGGNEGARTHDLTDVNRAL